VSVDTGRRPVAGVVVTETGTGSASEGGTGESLYRAWGEVTDHFWEGGADESRGGTLGPDAIRFRLAEISGVANDGDLDAAMTLIFQLDRDTTDAYGESYMYTVQVREVHGYVAALARDFPLALRYYVHTVRLRVTLQGPGHPEVEQAIWRAYGLWSSMPRSPERNQWGAELLTVVTDIHGHDAPVAQHLRTALYSRMLPGSPGAAA
jgi:hypothetical protein